LSLFLKRNVSWAPPQFYDSLTSITLPELSSPMDRNNFSHNDRYSSPSVSPRLRRTKPPRLTHLDVDFANGIHPPPSMADDHILSLKRLGRNNSLKFRLKVLQTLKAILFLQKYRTIWWYILLLIAALIYPFPPVSHLHSHLHSHNLVQLLWKQQRPLSPHILQDRDE
jgi:hypothetical protein